MMVKVELAGREGGDEIERAGERDLVPPTPTVVRCSGCAVDLDLKGGGGGEV